MNTDTAPSVTLRSAVDQFLDKLRKQGIIVQYAELYIFDTFNIGLSNFPAKFPCRLGAIAAKLERSISPSCSIGSIEFGSQHPTLGHKCTISLSFHYSPMVEDLETLFAKRGSTHE